MTAPLPFRNLLLHTFILLLLILINNYSFILSQEYREIFLSGFGEDSPTCSTSIRPCSSLGYALNLLPNQPMMNTSYHVQVNILDNFVNCQNWKFKNPNITKLHLTSWRKFEISCSTGLDTTFIPWIRFSNLNIDLKSSVFKGQVEIVDCEITKGLQILDIAGNMTLDNVTIGSQYKLDNLKKLDDSSSLDTIFQYNTRAYFSFSGLISSKSKVLIRNSKFMGAYLTTIHYWSGDFQIENSSFDYCLIQFIDSFSFLTGNNEWGRPNFVISGSTFKESSIQAFESKSISISNSQFSSNIPNRIGRAFSVQRPRLEFHALYLSSNSILNLNIKSCQFSGCQIAGAISLEGVGINANIENSGFIGNSNTNGGPAITLRNIYRLAVSSSLFENNAQLFTESNNLKADGGFGGGSILQYQSLLKVAQCNFVNNSALIGGAIFSEYGNVFHSFNNTFYNNSAVYGGSFAVIDSDFLTSSKLEYSTFQWNRASKYGGAIFSLKSSLDIMEQNNLISNNYASKLGGGSYSIGTRISVKQTSYSDNFCGNGKVSNFASFPTSISVSSPEKQLNFSNTIQIDGASLLEMGFGEKVSLNIDLHDNAFESVNSLTELDIQIQTSDTNQALEVQKISPNQWNVILYSRSQFQFPKSNSTLTFTYRSTLFSKESFYESFSIPISSISCKPWFSLQREQKIVNGDYAFSCQFNTPLIIPFIFIAFFAISCLVCIVITFACIKYQGMRSKVKILHKKEQAEVELTQKLLDLQSLYASELESKHSIKNWLIKIEDIKVIKKIGEGGMGIVYLAYWKNVEVALKSIKIDDDEMDTTEFEHESSMLSAMRHPNIVNFYGVVLSEQSKFMVTEYMNGGCLEKLIYNCKIKKKHLTLNQKVSILIGIANGMSYLHGGKDDCMIIHRDLKPGNILLSSDLTPKVCDFGLSKLSNISSKTTKTGHIGTLLFMSPEILLGKYYNEKSDVYSFAIIMWQLMFDENLLFQHNYGANQKYATIMSKQEIETFSQLANQTSLLLIPRLISEGLRLPLPTLPINANSQIMKMWIREYFIVDDLRYSNQNMRTSNVQVDPFDKYLRALNRLFTMIASSWCEDFEKRPSFSSLAEELLEIRNNLEY